jgi:hypothetical protein
VGSSKWFHLWLFGQISGRVLARLQKTADRPKTPPGAANGAREKNNNENN